MGQPTPRRATVKALHQQIRTRRHGRSGSTGAGKVQQIDLAPATSKNAGDFGPKKIGGSSAKYTEQKKNI